MGIYAEPKEAKDVWVKKVGRPIPANLTIGLPADELPVALLYQGFYGLAVGFSQKEVLRLRNGRPDAEWFAVKKVHLKPVVPGSANMEELK